MYSTSMPVSNDFNTIQDSLFEEENAIYQYLRYYPQTNEDKSSQKHGDIMWN